MCALVGGEATCDVPDDLPGLLHVKADLLQRVEHTVHLLALRLQRLGRLCANLNGGLHDALRADERLVLRLHLLPAPLHELLRGHVCICMQACVRLLFVSPWDGGIDFVERRMHRAQQEASSSKLVAFLSAQSNMAAERDKPTTMWKPCLTCHQQHQVFCYPTVNGLRGFGGAAARNQLPSGIQVSTALLLHADEVVQLLHHRFLPVGKLRGCNAIRSGFLFEFLYQPTTKDLVRSA